MTILEQIQAIVFKGVEPGTKEYFKTEYYLGQALATFGAEEVLASLQKSKGITEKKEDVSL